MAVKTYATLKSSHNCVQIACPLCGSSIVRKVKWKTQGIQFVQCLCGLWRQDPQPLQEEVTTWYDKNYLKYEIEYQFKFRDIALKSLADVGIVLHKKPEALPSQLLEIGCATGALLKLFSENGWETTGIEVSKELSAYGREHFGLDIRNSTLELARLPEESYSMIFAFHVIEHLNDPALFVAELYRILRHDGTLVIITPNADSFQAHLMQCEWRSAISDHLFLFSRKTLLALLENYNFAIEQIKTWGGWPLGMKPAWLKKPLDTLIKMITWGDVMIIRAVKP